MSLSIPKEWFPRFSWCKSSGEFFRMSDKELDRLASREEFCQSRELLSRPHYSYFRLSPLENFIKNLDAFHRLTEMSRGGEAAPNGFQSRYNRSWCCFLKTPTEEAHPQSQQKHDSPPYSLQGADPTNFAPWTPHRKVILNVNAKRPKRANEFKCHCSSAILPRVRLNRRSTIRLLPSYAKDR